MLTQNLDYLFSRRRWKRKISAIFETAIVMYKHRILLVMSMGIFCENAVKRANESFLFLLL